ncbi:MAG TPA: transcription-repair coupling factor, partial [Acidimicrobiales bacterium]|nr:transcription-repair coupling factor [Acidimicrobiales bacterium]
MSLKSLPPLLRDEPAMVDMLSAGSAVVGVPEAATAFVLAGLSQLGERRPILAVTPTVADAERLAHDLAAFLGRPQVELFPAWDTLPFERVSPETATIGQRLRVMWRLGLAGASAALPEVVVAPVRALLQRLGPVEQAAVPVVVAKGSAVDHDELVARLVSMGYRREYQSEHRGELSVRGGIVDVFPSHADLPVRIDLWGDEVDRLSEFDPGDQRSRAELDSVEIHACHELLPTDEVRRRA